MRPVFCTASLFMNALLHYGLSFFNNIIKLHYYRHTFTHYRGHVAVAEQSTVEFCVAGSIPARNKIYFYSLQVGVSDLGICAYEL